MEKPQPQLQSRLESQSDLRSRLQSQWRCQLALTMMFLMLLVIVNQVFDATSSLARFLGGLPLFGWAGVIGFLTVAALSFAWSDARRSRLLLEEPPEKFVDPNKQELCKELNDKYDANGPAYPHPVIIEDRCIGCGACVRACPHDVFTMVDNIAKPIARDQCMQDTSCQAVCPTTPVACIVVHAPKPKPRPFPICNDQFMSEQVSGCYLIGDVSGRSQIKNAANEGATVIKHIANELNSQERRTKHSENEYDAAIIGVGPAGLSAAIRAERLKLKYVAIEQHKVLSTLEAYPQDKDILFRPDDLKPCSDIPMDRPRDKCGNILAMWRDEIKNSGVRIREKESCKAVTKAKDDAYFEIITEKRENNESRSYRALRVILALGLRGTPMKLGGPGKTLEGETEDRVRYKLSKPGEFKDKRMLIVGGGNSAVEAALALAAQSDRLKPDNDIRDGDCHPLSLVVRNGFTNDLAFSTKQRLYEKVDKGEIKLYWDTGVKEICEGAVVLTNQHTHKETVVPNDYILALIGGDFPTKFLEKIGITIPHAARKKGRLRESLSSISSFLKRGLGRLSVSSRCPNSPRSFKPK